MAIRPKDVYRGKRPHRTLIGVLLGLVLLLLVGAVVLFFSLQRYIVQDRDGIRLELPYMQSETPTETAAPSGAPQSTLTAPVELVVTMPDLGAVEATAGEGLENIRGVYLPREMLNDEGFAQALACIRESGEQAIVMQLKPADGILGYLSTVPTVGSYGVNGVWDLRGTIAKLRESGEEVWLVAELSVYLDQAMAQRNTPLALKTFTGSSYADSEGYWLDPYNRGARDYIIELMEELAGMGVDEILLSNIAHPQLPELVTEQSEDEETVSVQTQIFMYSQSSTVTLDVDTCISNNARGLAAAMDGREVRVSALYSGATGQDSEFFLRVFDRLYVNTAAGDFSFVKSDLAADVKLGDTDSRIVPIYGDPVEYLPSQILSTWETVKRG